jgi:heme-degrading monooxygenase HmoA
MIARVWRGSTRPADADRYLAHLNEKTIPQLEGIDGYRGAYVMRRPGGEGIDFLLVTLWESTEAITRFAGPDAERAVLPPEARALLATAEPRAAHYDVVVAPGG